MSELTDPSVAARRGTRGERALRALIARLVAWGLRALAASWRVELRGADPFAPGAARPLLAGLWHQGALISAALYRDRGIHVAVSRSRDGGRIDAVLAQLGFGESVRGSSSRGASSVLRATLRQLEAGGIVVLLVDGPRGPAHVAKSGVLSAARLSGVPVLPVALAARPCLRFRSWDRMRLPLPFARVRVLFGEPFPVPRDADDARIEALRGEFEARLRALSDALDAELEPLGSGRARS